MIYVKNLIRETDLVMADWVNNLDTRQEKIIDAKLSEGGVLFLEIAQNPVPFEVVPCIRLGIHDPVEGPVYLAEVAMQRMN